ncbi:hypothetical protein GH714_025334 [Hevea brasiliensis]|uniref:Myb-like domain-containing protein n=1 Tax=Hevea brasiliensis TaxID=3981 RepID=A0A6A6LD36_HEVBR|nr:hypothetical protein GH714_025334 [Hevea brasiliensis]
MLGDSSSLLATTTTAAVAGGGGGGVATAGGSNSDPPPAPSTHQLPGGGGAHESSSEVGHVGSNNSCEDDKGRGDEGDRSFGVTPQPAINLETKSGNGDQSFTPASSSRWPKVEVEALIKLRTHLDSKYQENGPKGPLWEDISAGMRKLGYNRSAKRCKEKWENINKYFKKVKESNKKRPEDSKTCPYFTNLMLYIKRRTRATLHQTLNSSLRIQCL